MAQMQEQKQISLTINGQKVTVPAGTTVFNAAAQAGIFIPHYCYHQDLSIAGVCRMCMCDIEKNPRLQISCNTVATEGMVVRTDTEKVRNTVKTVLELHLINHPLDCPICDKAGECKLQDFYREFGLYESRMDFEKVHKQKAVDIGTIVLDSERCILCTRCVRFTNEVTKTNELGIFNRGDRSVLTTYDGGPLRNHYTGNLADICPVGALTAKDFRFKQRVWFLDKTSSVCGMCAHGCNTQVSVNPSTHKLFRVEPRRNPEVNKSWICDTGRWNYHFVYNETRLRVPKEKRDGVWVDQTWMDFFKTFHTVVGAKPDRVLVGLSTSLTNEEIADAVLTLGELGVTKLTWVVDESVVHERQPFDGILRHRDLTPNAMGFEEVMSRLKIGWMKQKEAIPLVKSGAFDWVLLVGLEGEAMPGAQAIVDAVPAGTTLAVHATTAAPWFDKCAWTLPNVSAFEKNGSFVSAQGRLQRVKAAIPWQFTGRDTHALVFGAARGHDREPAPSTRAQALFDSTLIEKLDANNRGITWRNLNTLGMSIVDNAQVTNAQP